MGLSASQARLLSLTARQSNIEYEGQQINQQRTTLSNESSSYYNSLLEMSVPVPPSTNDYTKIVYNFTIGGNEAILKEALPQSTQSGNAFYLVTYTTKLATIGIQENEAYKTAASALRISGGMTPSSDTTYDPNHDGKIYFLAAMNHLSNEELDELDPSEPVYVKTNYSSTATIIGPNGFQISNAAYSALSQDQKDLCTFYRAYNSATDAAVTKYAVSYAQIPNESTFAAHANDLKFEFDPSASGQGFYMYKASNMNEFTVVDPQYAESFANAELNINDYYQYESSSGIRFVKREDVEGNLNTQTRSIKTSAVATISVVKQNSMSNAYIEFDAEGRISTITDEDGHTYNMTATTETDTAAYDDAYNQYEYNQYVYDQRQNEINANIKLLQAQDKSLELRLSTLDTQHSAIQTEIEAVKKVMSKNIDNSFKTFNA